MIKRNWMFLVVVCLLFGMSFLSSITTLWVDWLWFEETGYAVLFTKSLTTQLFLGLACGVAFFLIVYANAALAKRLARQDFQVHKGRIIEFPQLEGLKGLLHWILLGGSALFGCLVGIWAGAQWQVYLQYRNALPFGMVDPLFSRDIGFYFFTLPFYQFLYHYGVVVLVFSFLGCLLVQLTEGQIWLTTRGPQLARPARVHLSAIVAVFLLLFSFHYRLEVFDLLFSDRGVVFGAGYTDIKAQLPVLRILIWVSALCSILVVVSALLKTHRLALWGIGALAAIAIAGNTVYPGIVQRFEVGPNEISKESPYIDLGIRYTQMAYGIHEVQEEEYPALENLSLEKLKQNELVLQNIRLWDHRPLLRTYGQLQVIRTYYDFVDVDNDRYIIDGQYRQVSLSPRELSSERLPSRIWINEHLTYTHGYGLCLGPVNQITPEGLPQFMIKDIPPVATTNVKVTQPQIYYGEITNSYCFVKTKSKEFDYPSGDENVYTEYTGSGGIPVQGLLRQLLFSFRFKELKILLSSDIHNDSRLMFDRSIAKRIQKLLPFVTYDRDPYMVVADDGRLFWMVDGYTVSDMFPYSQPTPDLGNYIRNSVKATVDAYNGTVQFYISDPKDLIIQVYSKIFPGVFKTMDEMPGDLRRHIRYPEDLFTIQANVYATYHMKDPQVFYNKEDLWRIPSLAQATGATPIEPYYIIMKLNSESREEFILMTPFTPARRENMIAWMAARCDEPNYGKLIVYNFPKQRLVYGPSQIVSRVNQDAEISKQLTLWSQGGSNVIRGSLLVIPVQESILYIQPLYLAASQESGLPELKRIIVAFGNTIAMEESLELSLARIFGGASPSKLPEILPKVAKETGDRSVKALVEQAGQHYSRAQNALKQGDWSGYGEEIKRLGQVLQGLREKSRE